MARQGKALGAATTFDSTVEVTSGPVDGGRAVVGGGRWLFKTDQGIEVFFEWSFLIPSRIIVFQGRHYLSCSCPSLSSSSTSSANLSGLMHSRIVRIITK